jgi:hypothetical protein
MPASSLTPAICRPMIPNESVGRQVVRSDADGLGCSPALHSFICKLLKFFILIFIELYNFYHRTRDRSANRRSGAVVQQELPPAQRRNTLAELVSVLVVSWFAIASFSRTSQTPSTGDGTAQAKSRVQALCLLVSTRRPTEVARWCGTMTSQKMVPTRRHCKVALRTCDYQSRNLAMPQSRESPWGLYFGFIAPCAVESQ